MSGCVSNAFFLSALLYADASLDAGNYFVAALAASGGAIVLAVLYWNFAFDERLRDAIRRRLNLGWAA